MSDKKENVKKENLSYEWERLPDGRFKRVSRVVVEVEFQESFADDSDFMPNINGISENVSGSSMVPQYDFKSKADEYDNSVMVAMRDPSLDPTEREAVYRYAKQNMDKQFEKAREDVLDEIEKIKSEQISENDNNAETSAE